MALDELKDSDTTFTNHEILYLIDKNLFDAVKPITVDFVNTDQGSGFQLTSNLSKQPEGGGGCCG